jgi:thiol:disulfide interchange protein
VITRISVLALGVFLLCLPAYAQETIQGADSYVPVTKFDPARDAAKDVQDAIREAERTGKRILLDVGGNWCVWCRRLDSLFQSDKGLSNFLHANFVVVKVNWSKENKNEALLSRYPKIPGYPHLFVLDSKGTLLHSQDTGQLESGKGHDPKKVMDFLKMWAPQGS